MTDEQYYQTVRSMGLRNTNVPNVYEHVKSGQIVNVQPPSMLREAGEMEAFLKRLRGKIEDFE